MHLVSLYISEQHPYNTFFLKSFCPCFHPFFVTDVHCMRTITAFYKIASTNIHYISEGSISPWILEYMDWKHERLQCYILFMVTCVPFYPTRLAAKAPAVRRFIIDTIHMDRKLPTMCGGSCVLHRKLHPQSSHGSITCIKFSGRV